MTVEVRLPQWGMGMLEGYLASWYKSVGDPVEADEPIAEVEAAKTTADVCAPVAGRITAVLVPEGETVPIHTLLALIEPTTGVEAPVTDVIRSEGPQAPGAEGHRPAQGHAVDAAPPGGAVDAAPPGAARDRRQIAPRTRRLARELAVDLASVKGTGPSGRVLESDVLAAAQGSPVPDAGDSAPRRPTRPAGPPPTGLDTLGALGGMRRVIAERMTASLAESAQFTLTMRADVTALMRRKKQLHGVAELTLTDLLVRAVAEVLPRHPVLNSRLTSAGIVSGDDVNVGIAVALDEGLVVPVIPRAQTLSLSRIRDLRRELVERARAGRLNPDDTAGGTFTISNLGGFGIEYFTPILNTPEVAILGVGAVSEVAVRFQGGLGWAKAMPLSLTLDHRVVDGAPGAAFLRDLAATLKAPDALLQQPEAR